MRFASANKNTGGNVVNAGNAAGNAAADFLETARKNATDYTEMARTNVKAGYDMQSKAIQYDAETKANKLKNEARVEGYDMEIDARIDANKQVRKAGMLAGFGKLAMAATKKRKKTSAPVETAPLTKAVPGEIDVEGKMEEWDKDHPMPTARTLGGDTSKPDESTGTISAQPGTPTETHTAYYNYLTGDKGLSRNKALGIMANISRESSFNPFSPSGDDNGAGGLFQYYDVRQTPEVEALVKAGDWKGQLDYALVDTVKRGETYLDTTFESAHQASDQWMRDYERPDDLEGGSKKHKTWLDTYGGGLGAT